MENALLPEMMPPREVLEGRYRFRTPLRSAGIGKLDCVEDVQTGQRRVVHWLPLEVNRYNQQNIVHLCAALPHHPCLPEVCEVGEMESWAFMVVDFPEGELLSARRELLKPETWRKMACQLASTLNVLHAQHIFHGELSMASIMVVGPEQYLLWDMPLVLSGRMADRRQEDRLLSQLTRTVSTMAPERARGGLLAPELDVYSLGAVLAYSVGSQQPTSSSVLTIVNAIAMGNFKPQLPNILPPAYRNMLERMLAPRASDRPSMHDVEAFFMRPPSLGPAPQLPSAGMPRVATPMMGQPVLYPMQPTPAPFPAPPPPGKNPPPPPMPIAGQAYPGYPGQAYPGQPAQPYPGQPYPGYPGQPGQPHPAYPGYPGQPYPGYPGQAAYPGYPGQPGQPYPGQPGQPPPAYPGQPAQPRPQPRQAYPAQPVQPPRPAQAAPPAQPVPAQPSRPAQPTQPLQPAMVPLAPTPAPVVSAGVEWMHTLPSQEAPAHPPPSSPPPSSPAGLNVQEPEREIGKELKKELEAEWEAEEEQAERTDSFSRF